VLTGGAALGFAITAAAGAVTLVVVVEGAGSGAGADGAATEGDEPVAIIAAALAGGETCGPAMLSALAWAGAGTGAAIAWPSAATWLPPSGGALRSIGCARAERSGDSSLPPQAATTEPSNSANTRRWQRRAQEWFRIDR
jgi:hypothetical protein